MSLLMQLTKLPELANEDLGTIDIIELAEFPLSGHISTIKTDMALESFTLFPELPSELRLKIWKLANPGPRILGVGHRMQYREGYGRIIPTTMDWRTSDPVPTLLHVCHDSRTEALKVYQPSFATFGTPRHEGKNYIDFSRDILYFGGSGRGFTDMKALINSTFDRPSNYLLDMFLGADYGTKDAEHIKAMIVDIDEERYGRRLFIWDEIRLFPKLQDLIVIVWEEDSDSERLMVLYRISLREVARKHPEWAIPKIRFFSAITKTLWGVMDASTRLVDEEDSAV
ncbi:uncharacterized protein PAC_00915 [Phialocephala subalpina]|uniref:2EXR domain-containing protein n=1 Tax=Phialocephala subalpina TaxID=576137 RepID=A0A1L7WE25_9HELO|nr:uncharacterized protein PAC_00915 [Phialocephala subalpina]